MININVSAVRDGVRRLSKLSGFQTFNVSLHRQLTSLVQDACSTNDVI